MSTTAPTDSHKKTYVLALFATAILIGLILLFINSSGSQRNQFSGERAMAHVREIVGFGPRPAGSEALEKSRAYIERELSAVGWVVTRQAFTKTTKLKGKVNFVNLRARFAPDAAGIDWRKGGGMVVVGSHYDTKWFEDFEFVGANDGGSSTGALIELGHVLGTHYPDIANRVELVFFDGEEAFGENIEPTDGLYGSHYYARALWRSVAAADKPTHGIVLDMIGDKDLLITPPPNSDPQLIQLSVDCARDLGYAKHLEPGTTAIIDDHVPLATEARFPAIDLIDFSYGPWHKRHDTLEQLSPESLEIAGQITVEMLVRLLRAESPALP
jgi:glutaminyl-peptide cyclotransferase